MFEHTSRYYNLETVELRLPDGRVISYKRRRFIPSTEQDQIISEVTVGDGERADQLAARVFGDALQFWRLCDANAILNPLRDFPVAGERLQILVPKV